MQESVGVADDTSRKNGKTQQRFTKNKKKVAIPSYSFFDMSVKEEIPSLSGKQYHEGGLPLAMMNIGSSQSGTELESTLVPSGKILGKR